VTRPLPGDSLIGRVIDDRYEILERIGEGGMGVVYKARQKSVDRLVAIKMLNQQLASDPNWVQRFYNEAKACSRLAHPNTIRMFDFGQTREGSLFMTMEYLDGRSLRAEITASSPMLPTRVMKILVQCCASLSEAHGIGIVHRDIKPDNVFLLNLAGSPDHVKLLDFSVAKLLQENAGFRTQAGVVFGTPQYMSPEQGRGIPLDARSDLYALGILGYEMLTGRVPFDDENPMTVLQQHLLQQVPALPPAVPGGVQEVVRRALEKDPGRRFQSAVEMMVRCQEVFAEVAGYTPPPMPAFSPPPGSPPTSGPSSPTAPPVMGPPPGGPPPPAGPPPGQVVRAAAPEARTMFAMPADVPPAAPPGTPPPSPAPGPQPFSPAPLPGAPPPQERPVLAPNAATMALPGGADPSAPKRTMLLQDSEGIISYAQQGASPPPARPSPAYEPIDRTSVTEASGGASILFWAICLLAGLIVGVGAYWAVIGLGG
jgi:eukaryotic-like serine/threonine-protein kinase